jgi:hypothetical protein
LQIDLYLLSFIGVTSLFYLDSTGKIEGFFYSFINAFKMFFYFLPGFLLLGGVCGLIAICFGAVIFLINYIVSIFAPISVTIAWPILVFLAHFFFLSVWTVYYIKIKHQDFQLFIQE